MTRILLAVATLAVLAAACGGPGPRPIAWGQDECDHCHMTVADKRFAAELVTHTGKAYVFDDIGCMKSFVAGGGVRPEDIHSFWLSDASAPGALHQAGMLRLVHSDSLRTPMASGLAAIAPERADSVAEALGGESVPWPAELTLEAEAP